MNEGNIDNKIKESSILDIQNEKMYSSILEKGLSKKEIDKSKATFGRNISPNYKKDNLFSRIKRSFINPFSIVLLILAIVSLFTDIIFAKDERNYATFSIILIMLFISGIIRLVQEIKSKKITDNLVNILNLEAKVKRDNIWINVPFNEIVVGDLVNLVSGNTVPADIRISTSNNLYISQSAITGESGILEKNSQKLENIPSSISEYKNIIFQGSTIISGECEGIVLAIGNKTIYGGIKPNVSVRKKGFDKGSNKIIRILIKFKAILIQLVFIISGITNGDWLTSFLFAISVAIGITPELLPMVITSCLSKGSFNMSKKQTVVKNINAMEGFGRMDTLCIDKTGTITQDDLILEYYIDILGNENRNVLDKVALNSHFIDGIINHLDKAIIDVTENLKTRKYYCKLYNKYKKLSELPFDYDRKISSVLLNDGEKNLLICKGDVDKIINKCKFYEYNGKIRRIEGDKYKNVHLVIDDILEDGMKVIAVANKILDHNKIYESDEDELVLLGYIVFFDAPKKSAKSAIEKLKNQNVNIKILTGDNLKVTSAICQRLGINNDYILTGNDINNLNEVDLHLAVEKANIFAELSPKQKSLIVKTLENNGHSVGFLGDGMNDLPAMMDADVSISVDTATPALKEIADVILLKKDLNVLEEGIIEGRKSFANMNKYIKITASSNFGNILSIIISSVFLPFFPMTAIQILLLNLLYDIICLVLPWDNVDKETCQKPLEWSGNTLKRFMLFFGPISTIFDILTFIFLFNYLCPTLSGGTFDSLTSANKDLFVSIFQTGFFLESMWTQILILHSLRTSSLSIIKSRASTIVFIVTILGIITFTTIAMTPLGNLIGLTSLPFVYFLFLIGITIVYLLLITLAKKIYVKKYNKLI